MGEVLLPRIPSDAPKDVQKEEKKIQNCGLSIMKQYGRTESKDADNFSVQFLFFNLLNKRLPSQNKMTSDIINIREPS